MPEDTAEILDAEIEEAFEEDKKKKKKPSASKGISKKRTGGTRPPARPHRKMPDEQLKYNMEQLKDRIDMTESRLKAYTVRFNKLDREANYRKEADA